MKSTEKQNDLFGLLSPPEERAPFQRHSDTSIAAARRMEGDPKTLNALQQKVLAFVVAAGKHGATDNEIQASIEMNPSTERPRRIELERRGLVKDSGRRRVTQSKRKAVVWVAVGKCHV